MEENKMSDHPIQGLMTAAMENLKQMVDVNTIIGDPVETPDGSVILTVSKVGFGFATGGSEFVIEEGSSKQPFGGGSGGGVSITPIAFLIVGSHGVKLLHLEQGTHLLEKLLDTAPAVVDKIQRMMSKQQQQKKSSDGKQNQSSNGKQNDANSQSKQDFDFEF
jgi:sporulation protein YtfJ